MLHNKTASQARAAQNKKGFTLTEIAIVLGIIGLILGAIWTAAAGVYNNQRVQKANVGIVTAAQALHAIYSSGTTGVAVAASIAAPGMFNTDWNDNTAGQYDNPWKIASTGGSAYIAGLNQFVSIELDGLPDNGCSGLLNYFSSINSGTIAGLVGTVYKSGTPTAGTSFITPATATVSGAYAAASSCTGGTGKDNISVVFDLSKM